MGEFTSDIEAILARRHDNGADFWASPEGKIYVGNPFSTITSLIILHELDVPPEHEAVSGGLELILAACRDVSSPARALRSASRDKREALS